MYIRVEKQKFSYLHIKRMVAQTKATSTRQANRAIKIDKCSTIR